jgi:adenosylcobinamide-phosphate synthase
MDIAWIILLAIVLDLLIGDPRWLPHPIRWMGFFISKLERKLRKTIQDPKFAGVLLWLIIVNGTLFLTSSLLVVAIVIDVRLGVVVNIIMIFFALAIRSLTDEGRVIRKLLKLGDLEGSRKRLQTIVSRDCSREDESGIIRGVIETLTENLSDGIIAPLFFAMIGGGPLALTYKAINTLDSMVGYKNEKYKDMGWFSAKADDVVNLIPARLTGLLIVVIAFFTFQHPIKAARVWKRDAQKGPSPNGGIPIVTFAGARDIQLGGDCFSQDGTRICIPNVGGERKKLLTKDIWWANGIIYLTTALIVSFFSVCVLGYQSLK